MQIIKNILLVDDSKIQQKMLKSLLEKEGYKLFISDTVSEGLKIIGTEIIDLVLIDFYLAGINDGTALVKKVRKYGFDIPVYAISGSEENSRGLLASGCNGVLSKDPAEIKKFILSLHDSAPA
jgi:CheY-like chemotaxis protein